MGVVLVSSWVLQPQAVARRKLMFWKLQSGFYVKFQTGIGSYRMCGKLANLAQTLNYGRSRMKSVLDSRKFGKDFVFFVFDTLNVYGRVGTQRLLALELGVNVLTSSAAVLPAGVWAQVITTSWLERQCAKWKLGGSQTLILFDCGYFVQMSRWLNHDGGYVCHNRCCLPRDRQSNCHRHWRLAEREIIKIWERFFSRFKKINWLRRCYTGCRCGGR